MTALWIGLAFVAGAYTWHRVGTKLAKRLGMNANITNNVVRSLSAEGLSKLDRAISSEITRRREVLR